MCLFFHKWGKWKQYEWVGKASYAGLLVSKADRGKWFDYKEARQQRVCSRCGKMEDQEI